MTSEISESALRFRFDKGLVADYMIWTIQMAAVTYPDIHNVSNIERQGDKNRAPPVRKKL